MEEWKEVRGTAGMYMVSNYGRVKSFKSVNPNGRILKGSANSCGYILVSIFGLSRHVHKLVAEAFIGPCPEGMVVHHKDDDRSNPRADNLEYITNAKNVTLGHARKLGLKRKHPGVYERVLADGSIKFKVQRYSGGKRHFLGSFLDLEDAIEAYESFEA